VVPDVARSNHANWRKPPRSLACALVALVALVACGSRSGDDGTKAAMLKNDALQFHGVTMMEAVHGLRARGLQIQFEREPLTEATVDRSRPILDSRRRFDVTLDTNGSPEAVIAALVAADAVAYDWMRLTDTPPSFFVFPRGAAGERMAASALASQVSGAPDPAGRTLDAVLADVGVGPSAAIATFDRPGFLRRSTVSAAIAMNGRPLYAVLGELFASSGHGLVWDLTTGVGGGRVMAVSSLPPPPR
jgi:hypothetical protein